MNCLPPQGLRQSRVVRYGANSFKELAVQQLCDAIILGRVVGGEASLCALQLQEICEIVTSVFATAVRPKMFDLDPVLHLRPRRKCLVSFESLILAAQKLQPGVTRVVVSKSDIILVAPYSGDGCRPPDVGVNFVAEGLSWGRLRYFANDFVCCFCMVA